MLPWAPSGRASYSPSRVQRLSSLIKPNTPLILTARRRVGQIPEGVRVAGRGTAPCRVSLLAFARDL